MAMAPEERKRRKRERFKQRYDEDQEFRAKNNAACRVRHQRNKAKINAERRRRYATDPEFRAAARADSKKSSRKSLLKKNYGMSLEEYAAKLAGQGGVCVICLEGHEKSLCVDHDHKTRKLRDLLCTNCNVGLGNYNDDPACEGARIISSIGNDATPIRTIPALRRLQLVAGTTSSPRAFHRSNPHH